MARSTPLLFAVAASLLLGACGSEEEPREAEEPQLVVEVKPLSAFTEHPLEASALEVLKGNGLEEPDFYEVLLVLNFAAWDGTGPLECPILSPEVVATLDGMVMRSRDEIIGPPEGCREPLFTLTLPRERFGSWPFHARFELRDDTHTMVAEFDDFYALRGQTRKLPVVACEGVVSCTSYSSN